MLLVFPLEPPVSGAVTPLSLSLETERPLQCVPEHDECVRRSSGCRSTATSDWKGEAKLFNIVANGEKSKDAAWCYEDPQPAARNIKGYVAFGKKILVKKTFLSPSK